MSGSPGEIPTWRRCTPADAEVLGPMNAQLSEDEGAAVGTPSAYLERAREWRETGRYEAAIAEADGERIGYVVCGVTRTTATSRCGSLRRGAGGAVGSVALWSEQAAQEFWEGEVLRLDVYDSNRAAVPSGRDSASSPTADSCGAPRLEGTAGLGHIPPAARGRMNCEEGVR